MTEETLEETYERMRRRLYDPDRSRRPSGITKGAFMRRFMMVEGALARQRAGLKPWPSKWELWLERWWWGIR